MCVTNKAQIYVKICAVGFRLLGSACCINFIGHRICGYLIFVYIGMLHTSFLHAFRLEDDPGHKAHAVVPEVGGNARNEP